MNNRIEHLDIIRGFAMLMVVLGHLVAGSPTWGISNWVNSFHLPLFMFVGGLLTYKTMNIEKGFFDYFNKLIYKRAISLLVPYLLWSCILYTVLSGSLSIDIIERLKLYLINPPTTVLWFLYTYFFLNLIYSIYLVAIKYLGTTNFIKDCIVIFILFIISYFAQSHLPVVPRNLAVFFPYFFFGVLFSKYDFIEKLIQNKYIITLCTIAFLFVSLQYGRYESETINLISKIVSGICGSLFFYYIAKNVELNSKLESMLITFGKNSIVIYIIHFTMLFSLFDILSLINLGQNHYLVFGIGLLVAIIISYSCVFFGNIFKQIPFLDGLLFGRWKF